MAPSTPRFVVSGAPSPWPEGVLPPKRLNIIDFIKNERMFSLYVQALLEMYQAGENDVTSFYQVGGIHGLPYVAWNGDPNQEPAGSWGGYCTHNSTIFPTWHRPYMVAFEQILQSHAARIAEEYTTERAEWRQAAAELRQPFWDWAAPGQAVPPDEVIRLTKVVIRAKPDGKQTEVENPLFTYKFKSIVPGSPPPFDKWHTTRRYPKEDGQSDPDLLVQMLSANQVALTNQTYLMLVFLDTWPEFGDARAIAKGRPATSLEGIHNSVHNLTGGGGHMSEPALASFDPIFFMHHTNVDRLLSLWAALHPGVWVTEDKEVDGTFDIPSDTVVGGTTSLFPFANSQDAYWTSNGSADTTRLGYTYPEFEGLDMNNPIAVKTAIGKAVNNLYSSSFLDASRPLLRHQPRGSGATSGAATTSPDTIWNWAARVRVKQFELERSFQVLIFLGSVPEDSNEWCNASSYVGSFGAFVNEAAEQCKNCQAQLDLVTEGYVNLVEAIMRHNTDLYPFDRDHVERYLKDSLHWRVQMANGTPVNLERLPSLEVTVIADKITLPFGSVLPVPVGEPVHHPGITLRRTGGARHA